MINFLIEKMIKKQIINVKDKELYEYGLKVGAIYFFGISFALLFSALLNGFFVCLFMILLFIPIRRFLGGFHFRNAYICFICSEIYMLLPLAFVPFFLKWNKYISILLDISFILLALVTCIFKSKFSSKRKYYSEKFKFKCTKKALTYELLYLISAHLLLNTSFSFISIIILYIFVSQFILFLLPEQSYV